MDSYQAEGEAIILSEQQARVHLARIHSGFKILINCSFFAFFCKLVQPVLQGGKVVLALGQVKAFHWQLLVFLNFKIQLY